MFYFTVEYLEIFANAIYESMDGSMAIDTLVPRYSDVKAATTANQSQRPLRPNYPTTAVALSLRR